VAVGSRAQETADAFGEQFDVPRRHPSYQAMADDGEVDGVYIATPHPMHKDPSILCLRGGKAVLCEKPFTPNAAQAEAVIDVARAEGVFCMEAMWSRFLPSVVRARELIDGGAIGEVRMILADFGFRCGGNPESRLMNPALAGGGLLDVGTYPISLSSMFLGIPTRATGLAEVGATGVDEQAGMVLAFEGGRIAVLATGVRTSTPHEATFLGTEGRLRLHGSWWKGSPITLTRGGQDDETIEVPMVGNGYNYEAREVARCVRAGKTESDVMPLDETLALLRIMDGLRAQWGVKYPFE